MRIDLEITKKEIGKMRDIVHNLSGIAQSGQMIADKLIQRALGPGLPGAPPGRYVRHKVPLEDDTVERQIDEIGQDEGRPLTPNERAAVLDRTVNRQTAAQTAMDLAAVLSSRPTLGELDQALKRNTVTIEQIHQALYQSRDMGLTTLERELIGNDNEDGILPVTGVIVTAPQLLAIIRAVASRGNPDVGH